MITNLTIPVKIGDIVRIETVTHAQEGVVNSIEGGFVELNPTVRNTDMVRLHQHLKGVVDDEITENELCPYGVKIAIPAIVAILPMDTPSTGWATNHVN